MAQLIHEIVLSRDNRLMSILGRMMKVQHISEVDSIPRKKQVLEATIQVDDSDNSDVPTQYNQI